MGAANSRPHLAYVRRRRSGVRRPSRPACSRSRTCAASSPARTDPNAPSPATWTATPSPLESQQSRRQNRTPCADTTTTMSPWRRAYRTARRARRSNESECTATMVITRLEDAHANARHHPAQTTDQESNDLTREPSTKTRIGLLRCRGSRLLRSSGVGAALSGRSCDPQRAHSTI